MANILSDTDGGLITADNCALVFIDHERKPERKPDTLLLWAMYVSWSKSQSQWASQSTQSA
jgi:hypothetical protein